MGSSRITPQLWECGKTGVEHMVIYCLYTIYLGK